ncbi:MAG: hypothetical protein DRR16_18220 [Candidatus Parabeggiatoa sp. nov. 3]|nr:MAG: hypothetical protein DRR00_24545 [Gammaproteobacteria bacterium]RKZ59967.1 MAG: hypothetical protein DRQ99_22860 [Gammaproteobacteria bacterium]RKZ83063.1 MAG: hypothetical protein DRR16_18220 [Gammaproteobacteria bacterium]
MISKSFKMCVFLNRICKLIGGKGPECKNSFKKKLTPFSHKMLDTPFPIQTDFDEMVFVAKLTATNFCV